MNARKSRRIEPAGRGRVRRLRRRYDGSGIAKPRRMGDFHHRFRGTAGARSFEGEQRHQTRAKSKGWTRPMSILDRSHTIAKPGFNRWMVPPAALCVHLCIGQAYAFSVFNLPMTKLIGVTKSAPDDWKLT